MAANNIGVPKRISAPNTIERIGIGDGGSEPSAPKTKQAPPAFTFGGAGSSSSPQLGSERKFTTSQLQSVVNRILDRDHTQSFEEIERALRYRFSVTKDQCSSEELPEYIKRAKRELRTEEFQIQEIVKEIMEENEEFSVQEVEEALSDKYGINDLQYTSEQIQQDFNERRAE